jgi:hypothetical protein
LQLLALAIVLAFFRYESVRAFCQTFARWKAAGGYVFSGVAYGLAGGAVPEIVKWLTGADRQPARQRLANGAFNFAIFYLLGMLADGLIRVLVATVGDNHRPATILVKVFTDQFIFTPVLAIPLIAIAYTWREHCFRVVPAVRSLGKAWYVSRVAPMLFPTWAYWVPMTSLMYTLPATLTIVFGAAASAASATVVMTVAERKVTRPHPPTGEPSMAD